MSGRLVRHAAGGALAIAALGILSAPAEAATGAASGGLVSQGKHLYGQSCIACHGANGEGVSGSSRKIGFGPGRAAQVQSGMGPHLAGVGALAADFYLRTGYMPLAKPTKQPRRSSHLMFSEREIRALVAYVASLGPGPAIPRPDPSRGNISEGKSLFTEHCAGCHQVVARGGYVTGAVAPPLKDATTTQIAQAVRIGPYVMPTFSKRAISDRQLDSIIRYVQYTKSPDNYGGWGIGNIGPVPEGLVAWYLGGAALVVTCIVIGTRLRRGGR
jgi:ubiquinol-cytochrome c reductase cytochrome c subunit